MKKLPFVAALAACLLAGCQTNEPTAPVEPTAEYSSAQKRLDSLARNLKHANAELEHMIKQREDQLRRFEADTWRIQKATAKMRGKPGICVDTVNGATIISGNGNTLHVKQEF